MKFHSMRDHVQHVVPVMGGVFGMKRGLLNKLNTTMLQIMEEGMNKFPHKMPGCFGHDQNFLTSFIWPHIKDT